MKQDIPGNDDSIKPLTYAVIEDEELRIWMSEDDDDAYDDDDDDVQSLDDYYDDIGSSDITFSDDDLHTSLESIDLSMEEVEEHEALLDGIIQEYIRTWDEQNRCSEQPLENIEAEGNEHIFSDSAMEDDEAEDLEDIFSHKLMQNMEAEDLEDIFSDWLMQNIETEDEDANDDQDSEA